MSDNLSVSISADTSKARAEIDLLNAKIRSLRKEVRSASDEAQKSGTITPRLAQARASLDVAERQLAAYNRTGRETTRTNIAMSASFDGLVRQVGNLARATGLAIPGLKAMRAGFLALVGVEILRGLQSVTESITQIVDLAKQTGGTTEGIQVLTKAIVETGGHAEDATAIYQKMGQIWQGVQKQALETGNTLGKGAQVLRGGVKDATNEITSFGNSLVTVLRPGQAGGTDFSSIFTALKIDPKAIKSFEDLDIKIKRAIVSLHDSGQTIKANAVLVEFFGKTWAEVGDGLRETVKQFDAVKGRTRLISPEDKARNEAYQKSLADLSDAFSSFLRNGLMPILPHVTRFMELVTPIAGRLAIVATTIIGAAGAWRLLVMVGLQLWPVITGIGSAFAALLPWINSLLAIGRALLPVFAGLSTAVSWPVILGRAIVALVANVIAFREKIGKLYDYLRATFGSTVGTVAQAFQDAWNAAFDFVAGKIAWLMSWYDYLIAKAKAALAFVGQIAGASAGGGTTTAPETAGGFASGGYVRGRGTGTSDSIWARVSNGEFVVNAGSVRRLGVGFLEGLNAFAAGGLVGASPISFAAGGLVPATAAGGRPVHLHLGSRSFALSGPANVVDALVSEAHWQQVKSAGVKPSWFAARPSGR